MTDRSISLGGAVIFWSVGERSIRSVLKDGLDAIDMGKFAPEGRTPLAALKDALGETFSGTRWLIQSLSSKDGFAVARVERGLTRNHYPHEMTAKLDARTMEIGFDPLDDRAQAVVEKYNAHLGLLTSAQVAGCMVDILDHLGATRLRPSGGFYWLPSCHLERWQEVAAVVERSGFGRPNCVYQVRHAMDQDAVRAVRDAITAEVQAEAQRLDQEISSGTLGEKALMHREEQANNLRRKLEVYEGILDVGLENLHATLDQTMNAAAKAALLASAADTVGAA